MHLLITTYKYLIVFNLVKKKWEVVHKGEGIYYGIAKYKDLIIVGKRNNPNKTNEDMSNYSGSFLILNHNLKIIDEIKPTFPIRDLHGINVYDNKLWATCSFDNMVAIYDFNTNQWSYWNPNEEANIISIVDNNFINNLQKNKTRGQYHYNTIIFNNNTINLMAHNFGDSEVYYFNYDNLKFIKKISLGTKAHNLWLNDDEIFTLSGDGYIKSNKGFSFQIEGYPRGYFKNDNKIFIGVCHNLERKDRILDSFFVRTYDHSYKNNVNYYFKELGGVTDLYFFDNLEF